MNWPQVTRQDHERLCDVEGWKRCVTPADAPVRIT